MCKRWLSFLTVSRSSLATVSPSARRKYHQGNFFLLPVCMFSSVPGLFLNSVWLPAQTEVFKPQHPCFVVFGIWQFRDPVKLAAMFSSSPLSQFHCKLFAKMGDDRPFVCNAPGCGQVSLFFFFSFLNFCVKGVSPFQAGTPCGRNCLTCLMISS